MDETLFSVGDHGPLFKPREPWTMEDLKYGATPKTRWGFRCRHGRHKFEMVADAYEPDFNEAPIHEVMLTFVRNMDTLGLLRCERCGTLRVKRPYPW